MELNLDRYKAINLPALFLALAALARELLPGAFEKLQVTYSASYQLFSGLRERRSSIKFFHMSERLLF